jgi:WD40 repeat protein
MNLRKLLNSELSLNNHPSLYYAHRDNSGLIQRLELNAKLEVHGGCVNTISWNEAGDHIVSGSDDQFIAITNAFTQTVIIIIIVSISHVYL